MGDLLLCYVIVFTFTFFLFVLFFSFSKFQHPTPCILKQNHKIHLMGKTNLNKMNNKYMLSYVNCINKNLIY